MIKLEAKNKGNRVAVKREVDGLGEDVLKEGLAVISSVINLYARESHQSEAYVCRAVLSCMLEKSEGRNALADEEGTDLC